MSEPEVTEADREKAAEIAGWPAKNWTELRDAIAAALAAERAKAREPFLALADHLAYRYPTYDSRDKVEESRDAAALIRRAAKETE